MAAQLPQPPLTRAALLAAHDPESDSDYRRSSPASPLFSPGEATDCTSDDGSVDVSQTQDVHALTSPAPSVYSLTESLIQNSFRHEYGREIQNHSEIYALPADGPEIERLEKQHAMLKLMLGRYPPPLADVLAPEPGLPKAVLDLGCGSGCWLIDVANDFPHVDCVGVDLVPLQPQNVPPNLRTEVDDINLPLDHFTGEFDVVNTRLISAGIKDYAGLIDQISRILRPGGLFVASECDFRLYDAKRQPYITTANPTFVDPEAAVAGSSASAAQSVPATAQYLYYMRRTIAARGGTVEAAALLPHWIKEQKESFVDMVHDDIFVPLTANLPADSLPEDLRRAATIGALARDDCATFTTSGRPLLLKAGLLPAEVDSLLRRTQQELADGLQCFMRVHHLYARKRANPPIGASPVRAS